MEYRPLSLEHGEIRLLTILSTDDCRSNPEGLVECTLEHVRFEQQVVATAREAAYDETQHRRSWPEAHAEMDTSALWKAKQPTTPMAPHATLVPNEDDLIPRRFAWGDYVALSYCWGSALMKSKIRVNGRVIDVGANLEAALRQLQSSRCMKRGFKMWVDALCIDQSNVEERGQQVGRMRDIYAAAWHVVIWLGTHDNDSELAMTAIKHFSRRMGMANPLGGLYRTTRTFDARPLFISWAGYRSLLRQEVLRSLYYLINRPYWRRLWILQEVALGQPDATVLCGTSCVLWKDIYTAACLVQLDENRLGRDIIATVKPRAFEDWSWEFARDRIPSDGPVETPSEFLWKFPISLMAIQQDEHASDTKVTVDELEVFRIILRAKVTDPKDRVYGMLGLSSVSSLANMQANYRLSLRETYLIFSKQLILRANLNALRLVQSPVGEINTGWTYNRVPTALNHPVITPLINIRVSKGNCKTVAPSCSHTLPSWAICWACPRGPTAQLLGQYSPHAGIPECAPIIEGDDVVKLTGIEFDRVNSLSAFHTNEAQTQYPHDGKPCSSIYGDTNATREALWRTLVGDTARDGTWAPASHAFLLTPALWQGGVAGIKSNGFGLHDFMARNRHLPIFDSSLHQLLQGKRKFFSNKYGRLYNPTEGEREALSWAMNAMAWRRLITTEKGYLGLAIADTQPGDFVCILARCRTPLIFRRSGGSFRVIGECYIHGIMRGEMAKDIENGQLSLREFRLC